MRNIPVMVCFALFCVRLSSVVFGITSEVQRVADVSGGTSSNSTYILAMAIGQPHPVGFSYNSTYLMNDGFCQSDTNEMAVGTDTDGDGFSDWTELSGSQFSPNTPTNPKKLDSDGDGVADQDEIVMGTNPMDANSCLKILSIEPFGTGCVVKWLARQSFQYSVLYGETMDLLSATPVTITNMWGGAGAGSWLATECQALINSHSTNGFYKVQLVP